MGFVKDISKGVSLISAMSLPIVALNVCVRLSPSSSHGGVE